MKERTLGIEVFDRCPDYDTNADPVVRFSASEVRKRIAQYYHESGDRSEIQIELPLGSYAPEFRRKLDEFQSAPMESFERSEPTNELLPARTPEQAHAETAAEPSILPRVRRNWLLPLIAVCSVAAVLVVTLSVRASKPKPIEQFWKPLLQMPGPIQMVVGSA